MKRSRLGSLDIASLGLGSAPLGGLFTPVSDADAEATIARAWSLGIRFFDTAPLYGFGLAERRLGAFLRQQPRDSCAISTKVDRLHGTPDAAYSFSLMSDRARFIGLSASGAIPMSNPPMMGGSWLKCTMPWCV